jgi:hypothetical protein
MTLYSVLMPSNCGGNVTLLVNCHSTEIRCVSLTIADYSSQNQQELSYYI